jgi:hypothetical protein
MTKSRPNIRTYIWTVSILILCGLIIYFDSSLNTCYGLVHGFGDLFLLLILFVLLTAFIGRQIYKIVKKADNGRVRIWTSLVVIIVSVIAFQGKSTWKNLRLGNSILSASIYPDQLDIGQLELIDEERYYALYGHIDWSCAFTESYEKNGDTLILAGQPFEKTDGILADKYLMTDSTLIPIILVQKDMERTETMRIEIKN